MSDLVIRPSIDADLAAIHAIYEPEVRSGTASFELDPPTLDEMGRRRAAVLAAGMPYLVATRGDQVLGYAYSGTYRARPAYRFTVEDSVYVAAHAKRMGVGRALLSRLIEDTERAGARQMVAIITTVPGTDIGAGSVRLHAALGFAHAGTLGAVGWKLGRWLDTVRMQRALGEGRSSPPA